MGGTGATGAQGVSEKDCATGATGATGADREAFSVVVFRSNQSQSTLTIEHPIPFPNSQILSPNITIDSTNSTFTVANASTHLISYQLAFTVPTVMNVS